MTRIYLDTEFLDDRERIHLISIGLEADTSDGYYGISAIRRQRNHVKKITGKPYAGKPHVRN